MASTTPMLRSQTSTVLTPQWISTLGPSNSSLHVAHHQLPPPASNNNNSSFPHQPPAYSPSSTAASPGSATTSPSTLPPPPPPPPPAYGGGGAPSNNNSMVTRSPYFGGVGVSQTGGRATLSAGLASWRNAGPTTNSPGISPSLGPSALGSSSSPPPPPPSYNATVTTVSGTSNQSKKATLFCEIADQVYTRIVNESRYTVGGAVPIAATTTKDTSSSTSAATAVRLPSPASATAAAAAEKAEKEKEAEKIGKYLNVIRIAGLGDDGKTKISSAVTLACQTSLSEPSGRFFVFELPPVGAELWPSHSPLQSGVESSANTPITEFEPNSAFGPSKKQLHGDHDSNELSSSVLPPAEEDAIWLKSRVCCVACPDQHLMQSLFTKLQEVFGSREGVKLDFVQRNLPLSCCLVIKASNSANKNHEAEIVPWGDLMEIGAEITVTTNTNNNNKESGEFGPEDGSMMLPNASSSDGGGPPPNRSASSPNTAKPSTVSTFPLPSYQETVVSKTEDTTKEEKQYVPAPFIPSYFRLLRNERGVFRNALFLRFKSQAKAEISMMYLERLNLCGRRIRVEHKKQSRSSIVKDTNTPTAPVAPTTTTAAAAPTTGVIISNTEIMEANINDLLRRYDRDGFSYPKRLLTEKDLKFLTDLVAAHELTFETGNTTVSVIRPRKSGGTSSSTSLPPPASSASLANKQVSPALGSSTPPWAPQTPPLAPKSYHANPNVNSNNTNGNGLANASFSEKLESGTMTFRGLRHWKEQRAAAASENGVKDGKKETSSSALSASSSSAMHHEDDLSGLPPAMSLDSGSATSKYVRCLDWQEAQKQGIAAWGAGRGRPVRT
jgi:hypothetical protein